MAKKPLYPTYTLDEALLLAKTIHEQSSGKPMRRVTLFDAIKKSPDSGPSRMLVTASSCYGLTEGGYQAESLKLTDRGSRIVSKNDPQAKIDAVMSVPTFKSFLENYAGNGVPSEAAAIDFLKSEGVPEERAKDCLKILLNTARNLKLVKETSGKERVLSIDHALEELGGALEDDGNDDLGNEPKAPPLAGGSKPAGGRRVSLNAPALNINIQIELPGNATPEQYESIFKNMRKYLFDDNAEQ